jgi:GNAT superfamily N-acetyltransferase
MSVQQTVSPPSIRTGVAADAVRIGAALGPAFFDDPVMRWCIPDDERRRRVLPQFFELYAQTFLPYGEVYVTADLTGAALWAPPGQPAVDDRDADDFAERMEDILSVDAARTGELEALLDAHHPHDPLFYLQFLGVEPAQQGHGVGSALMAPVLERCDREGLPAYLDATSARNRILYERHGFRTIAEIAPASGPPLWQMWRDPRSR